MFDSRKRLGAILAFVLAFDDSRVRDIHFFDMFSGQGEAAKTWGQRGYNIRSYDIASDPMQDLTTEHGFYDALTTILGLLPGALILLGPPCGLWVFMTSSVHKRTRRNPIGDTTRLVVRQANCLVRNLSLLLAIAHYRRCWFVLEQPGSSRMWRYPSVALLFEELKLCRVYTWLRCFGHLIPKPTYLLSNMYETWDLRRVWSKKRSFERRDAC